MTISAVDLFSIGIGPSSSHTVGPMRAAGEFLADLPDSPALVRVELRGSLAATGRGHGTDRATLLGLVGWTPTTVSADVEPILGERIDERGHISGPSGEISYELTFNSTPVPEHPNCVIFSAYRADGTPLAEGVEFFSVGGGFVQTRAGLTNQGDGMAAAASVDTFMPHPFNTWEDLRQACAATGKTIADIMVENETAIHGTSSTTLRHLDSVWEAMQDCVSAGWAANGTLPGGLGVKRRAPGLLDTLKNRTTDDGTHGLPAMDWINLYALAVNEENAAGGRVVTAPTNGAAGIIPAVMHYCRDFVGDFNRDRSRLFLLTAAAVGIIIKENASISGAEVGCQGEVGSASSMAAAGLCAVLGGTPGQIGNAAEIALEHNLGLTCDPVGGLVQIPCIERNAIGGVKAVNAARLALHGEGDNLVTLDDVIFTMAETGRDMLTKYKETSTGGLAVNIGLPVSLTEC